MFWKKAFLKTFAKLTGKYLYLSVCFNIIYGTKYSRMHQVKFVEDSL